ncbi:Transcription initiation factor TFIID subunit 8 [Blattella germanica]|nr:Transcription initiation factor TFIID subunit 8 [Blattella germanica]
MDAVCRRALTIAVAGLVTEFGFEYSDRTTLETLSDIIQSLIRQIGLSAHRYCELAGRVEPLMADVLVAMDNIGISMENMEDYARRPDRTVFPPLSKSAHAKRVNTLHVGKELAHPPHIPSHLPPFPDPHSFICTTTHRKPAIEYETLREKASTHQKCVEKALTKFVAKTTDTQSYFSPPERKLFPLVPCQSRSPPYLRALLTCDQMFYHQDEFNIPHPTRKGQTFSRKPTKYVVVQDNADEAAGEDAEPIDNPYLRPVKIKLVRKKRQRKC